jgi:hypothetical protein
MIERSIRGIFQTHFADYARTHRLPLHHHRAAFLLANCRSAALGGHVQGCPEGHMTRVWYNSCRHRACPQCAQLQVERWLETQRARLLPCAHHHLIFTIPHELNPLWRFNRRAFADLLFHAVRDTLFELLHDDRYLGAEPGCSLALHTWGRSLNLHPHIHALVSDGGMAEDAWCRPKGSCFLPVRVVMTLFRGKLLAALRQRLDSGRLRLVPDRTLAQHTFLLTRLAAVKWNVHLRTRYAHGTGVLTYLARYVRGGPLKNSQLVGVSAHQITYRYRPHRDDGDARPQEMSLAPAAFLDRLLIHVPPARQPQVRHYGLYAHTRSAAREGARRALGAPSPPPPPLPLTWQAYYARLPYAAAVTCCPRCHRPLVRLQRLASRHDPPAPSS